MLTEGCSEFTSFQSHHEWFLLMFICPVVRGEDINPTRESVWGLIHLSVAVGGY